MIEKVDSFKNRLEHALKARSMRPVELSEKTKIPQSTISQYRSGYAEPKSDKLTLIANALSVNPTWLMGIDVPMELDTAISGRKFAAEIIDSDIKKFGELSDRDRQIVRDMIDRLYERTKTD